MRWAVVWLVGSGCSQILGLDDPQRAPSDALLDDATPPADAVPDAFYGVCVTKWFTGPTFTPAVGLSFNTITDDSAPMVSSDGLEIEFSRNGEVFQGTRSVTTENFGNINRVGSLSSTGVEGKTWLSANRLRAFVASTRNGGTGSADIWRATRTTTNQAFSTDQTHLTNVNTDNYEADPHLSQDLLHLYLAVGANAQTTRLAIATRASVADAFSAPTQLTELAESGTDQGPSLTGDERVIVFASTRGGTYALYYATRPDATSPFSAPKPLAALDSANVDFAPHISEDGCTLYFSTDRAMSGNLDIYMTTVL